MKTHQLKWMIKGLLLLMTLKTNKIIYAIGDVAGGILLAHKASKEAVVAVESISGVRQQKVIWLYLVLFLLILKLPGVG